MPNKPNVIIIAGPNGAGKSTATPLLLKELLGVTEFVNADVIAQGLSGFATETVAFQAGRIMPNRLHELAEKHRNFVRLRPPYQPAVTPLFYNIYKLRAIVLT